MIRLPTYVIDIDGVLCHTLGTDYEAATPRQDIIDRVNRLHDKGHYVIITTGRGVWSGKDYEALTVRQLTEWGVRYHELRMGKEPAYVIDDMAYRPDEVWPAERAADA